MNNLFFYIPIVSKSLLTVLGTSPCLPPQTANCSQLTPLLVKGTNTLDKRSSLAGRFLSVVEKLPVVRTPNGVDMLVDVAALPADIWPWKAKPQKGKPFPQGLDFTSRFPPPGFSKQITLPAMCRHLDTQTAQVVRVKLRTTCYLFLELFPTPGPARRPSGGARHLRSVRAIRSRSDSVYVRIRATIQDFERGS